MAHLYRLTDAQRDALMGCASAALAGPEGDGDLAEVSFAVLDRAQNALVNPVKQRQELTDALASAKAAKRQNIYLRLLLATIADLVSWHMDTEADPENESPEDMTAHVNGLVWQLCQDQVAE